MPTRKPKRQSDRELEETCSYFGSFIETRYDDPARIPAGDERLFYHVQSLCGMIDSDGMDCLLSQPATEQQSLFRSARKLGLSKLVEHVRAAAIALRKAGLSIEDKFDRRAIGDVLKPFENHYYDRLRRDAYERMYRLISESDAFIPYALNCQRMDKEGGNPFDPKEWTPAKMKKLKAPRQ